METIIPKNSRPIMEAVVWFVGFEVGKQGLLYPRCAEWDWNVDPYYFIINLINVGKYSSPMEHMAMGSLHFFRPPETKKNQRMRSLCLENGLP